MTEQSHLWNEDLAPVPQEKRTWGMWNIAALWVGMSVCIPTYTIASSMIGAGMTWKQALLAVTLGNIIVLIPMVLNAHAGTKYGIPFPVLLRSSFGTIGSNIAALMRGLVACGWFGIQTWIGGWAIYMLHSVIFDFEPVGLGSDSPLLLPVIGLTWGQLACFLLFWAINIVIILMGIESIKWLETLAAPFLILIGLALLWWGISNGGGLANILSESTVERVREGSTQDVPFWPWLTAMVGFWATLSLNIPDFTRYARSQRDQFLGQVIGLPTTMTLFCFIGIAVTCATVVIFGEAIWDPVELLRKFDHKVLAGFALFCLSIATLSTNIAANVVSPANDLANLAPRKISFRTGGVITGIIGLLIFPWKLWADPSGYIFTWLIGYSGLLGAIGGVMIADYYALRRARLNTDALYDPNGEYSYAAGINWRAVASLLIAVAPIVVGFLAQIGWGGDGGPIVTMENVLHAPSWKALVIVAVLGACLLLLSPGHLVVGGIIGFGLFVGFRALLWVYVLLGDEMQRRLAGTYTHAWFVAFAVAFALYLVLMKLFPPKRRA